MKSIVYKQMLLFLLGLIGNNLFAQTISGPTEICPGINLVTGSYTLTDNTCSSISNINWNLNYPTTSVTAGSNPVTITWSTLGSGPDQATLTATYDCTTYDSDGNPQTQSKTATLIIYILNVNTPIIASPSSINLLCNDVTPFTISITPQPGPASYSVEHPDCFSYTYANNQFTFTPDAAAYGEICITIAQTSCNIEKTECITVARNCANDLTFSSASPITNEYNSVNNYIVASDVSTNTFSNVEFKAGKAVTLEPGFSANEVFLAHIGPCSCLPEGVTGCFYGKSRSSRSNRNNARSNKLVNIPEHKMETISAAPSESTFGIYPNPTQGVFTIHLEEVSSDAVVQVFDLMGRLRKTVAIKHIQQTIDASELENGVYIVVLSGQERLLKEKIIISK